MDDLFGIVEAKLPVWRSQAELGNEGVAGCEVRWSHSLRSSASKECKELTRDVSLYIQKISEPDVTMGRSRYKIRESEYPYFMTSSIVDNIPLFSDPELALIVSDALFFLQKKREVVLYSYVIMENHIHLLAFGEHLPKKMQRFKSFTARAMINSLEQRGRKKLLKMLGRGKLSHKIESQYQVWQEGYHPKQITTDKMMLQKMDYIHNNPVKRGYVEYPEHWRYSSARNYTGLEGMIPVTLYCR